jgi:flagellin
MLSVNTTVGSLLAGRAYSSAASNINALLGSMSAGVRPASTLSPAAIVASTHLRSSLASLQADSESLGRSYSQASVAEGALAEISGQLIEARALATANASDALTDAEKQANQMQIDSILANVDRIASTTSYAGSALLDGSATLSAGGAQTPIASVGATDLGAVEIDGNDYTLADLKTGGALETTGDASPEASAVLDAAIEEVATLRGSIGAFQADTVEAMQGSIQSAYAQVLSADAVIRDTDYAAAAAALSRERLLGAASLAMLDVSSELARNAVSLLG